MLICPVCGKALVQLNRVCRCEKGHSYDLAAQGYVNLLPVQKKNSLHPGDNAEMVAGRTRFLDSGWYQPLSDRLNEVIVGLCRQKPRLLDLGCGEGYYTARLWAALTQAALHPTLWGVDLSKSAVKHAARRCPAAQFVVASLFELPVASDSLDLCCNVFSPLGQREIVRVLGPGGCLVAVYPAQRHLFGLKEVLYNNPYENPEETLELEGLTILERERVTYRMHLEGGTLIQSLFGMTPYCFRTPREGCERLRKLETLDSEADFWVVVYRRKTDDAVLTT